VYSYYLIPYFLTGLVTSTLLFCLFVWWRGSKVSQNSVQGGYDSSTVLLYGLLSIAVFALGALLIYVVVHFE
jgi:hypothetical protein